jgi:hypothetical protein
MMQVPGPAEREPTEIHTHHLSPERDMQIVDAPNHRLHAG